MAINAFTNRQMEIWPVIRIMKWQQISVYYSGLQNSITDASFLNFPLDSTYPNISGESDQLWEVKHDFAILCWELFMLSESVCGHTVVGV